MQGNVRLSVLVLPGAIAVALVIALGGPSHDADRAGVTASAVGPADAEARRVISPDFDPTLTLRDNDRLVVATGPHGCEGDKRRWRIDVTLSQAHTSAFAFGHTQGHCSGIRHWEALVVTRGAPSFEPGPAFATGTYATREREEISGNVTWSSEVHLVRSGERDVITSQDTGSSGGG